MLVRDTSPNPARGTRRGFTLLEVLVVVAIIVMLAGVGGYYLVQRYEESKLSTAKISAEGLSGLVEQYKLKNGDYPGNIEALAEGPTPLCSVDKTLDPWGKPFQIDASGSHNAGQRADVFTTAPDGTTIGNWK